jgi:hypothetical protein
MQPEQRTITLPRELRIIAISAEDRAAAVEPETRVLEIPA